MGRAEGLTSVPLWLSNNAVISSNSDFVHLQKPDTAQTPWPAISCPLIGYSMFVCCGSVRACRLQYESNKRNLNSNVKVGKTRFYTLIKEKGLKKEFNFLE